MRIFKYLHPDRTDVLLNQTIRFSSPKVLNDPFELKPHLSALGSSSFIDSAFEQHYPKAISNAWEQLPPDVRKAIPCDALRVLLEECLPQTKSNFTARAKAIVPNVQSRLAEQFENEIGILCLTESPANLLMWAHYADCHRGFIIEFDGASPFFDQRGQSDDELRHLRKVVYKDERPSIVLADLDSFEPFLTKGTDWKYEAEWRMMMPLASASKTIGSGPEAIHLFGFPASAIKSVILGCRMAEEKRREIDAILRQNPEYEQVHCAQAKIDERSYQILIMDSIR